MHANLRKTFLGTVVACLLISTGALVAAETHRVVPGDTLFLVAQRYGTTVDELKRRNGLTNDVIYPGQTLAYDSTARSGDYEVRAGDSLYLIARRNGINVEALKTANGLSGDYIKAGQRLTIPSGNGSGGSGGVYHAVRQGDSLYLVASRYGTSVAAIMNANGLSNERIYPGQQLLIPDGGTSSHQSGDGSPYTVKAGDTLYLLAARHGTTVGALYQANGLTSDAIYPGQSLLIPSGGTGQSPANPPTGVSQSDLELLARLVSAEAGGESYAGQVAVAATILNRLRDPKYPKTIEGIIYQYTDGAYQYSPVMDGRIDGPASASAKAAVRDALNGWDPSYGATGFYNPAKTDNPWVQSQPVTTAIGDHVFFKY